MKFLSFASLTLLIVCFSVGRAQWRAQYASLPAGVTTKQLYFAAVDAATCWAVPVEDATAKGVFIRTANGGTTWVSSTVPGSTGVVSSSITAVDAQHAWIMFDEPANGGGIYATTDGGATWLKQSSAFGSSGAPRYIKFFDTQNGLAVGSPNGGYWEIYTTTNGGTNWVRVPSGNIPAPLSGEAAFAGGNPAAYGNRFFWFTSNSQSVYRTTNRGLSWTVSRNAYPGAVGMGVAFRDSLNGLLSGDPTTPGPGFRKTTDGGNTWTQVAAPTNLTPSFITSVPGTNGAYVASSFDLFGWRAGSAYTYDDGDHWFPIDSKNHGRTAFITPTVGWSGGGSDSLYQWKGNLKPDLWSPQFAGLPSAVSTKQLYFGAVNSDVCWAVPVNDAASRGSYIRTTNGGASWTSSTVAGTANVVAASMTAVDSHHAWIIFDDAAHGGGVYATTNGGTSWTRQGSAFGSSGEPRFVKFFDPQNGLAVGNPNGGTWEIYTSTNGGGTWTRVPSANIPAPLSGEVAFVAGAPSSYGNSFWFPTSKQSLYRTTDRGATWTVNRTAFPGTFGFGCAFKDSLNGLLAGDLPNVRSTTDGGVTFKDAGPAPAGMTPGFLAYVPGTQGTYMMTQFDLFGWSPGSAYTRDDGETWILIDTKNHGRSAFLDPSHGWSGGGNDSLYAWDSTDFGKVLLPINEDKASLPSGFSLEQNYPNPFNPTTMVSFQLPVATDVRIMVYDMLGREVATLVNERKDAGSYTVHFNAAGVASGVYLYRLSAGEFVQTRKMVLLK